MAVVKTTTITETSNPPVSVHSRRPLSGFHRSEEEKRAIVAEFLRRKGTVSIVCYCVEKQISVSTLHNWIRQYRSTPTPSHVNGHVRIASIMPIARIMLGSHEIGTFSLDKLESVILAANS